MKYIGLTLLVFSGYFAYRSYRAELLYSERLLGELISLLREHRHKVGFLLMPMSRWVGGFDSELLMSLGVLDALEKLPPREAFMSFKSKLRIPLSAIAVLGDFFEYSGTQDGTLELSRCDSTLAVLEKIHSEEKGRTASRLKLALAIGFAVILGTLIIML